MLRLIIYKYIFQKNILNKYDQVYVSYLKQRYNEHKIY